MTDTAVFDDVQITPQQLVAVQQTGEEPLFLVDVRTPDEYQICHLDDTTLIPLNDIPSRLNELPDNKRLIFICHRGVRSLQAAQWVRSQGLPQSYSLIGGVERWALEIDTTMKRY